MGGEHENQTNTRTINKTNPVRSVNISYLGRRSGRQDGYIYIAAPSFRSPLRARLHAQKSLHAFFCGEGLAPPSCRGSINTASCEVDGSLYIYEKYTYLRDVLTIRFIMSLYRGSNRCSCRVSPGYIGTLSATDSRCTAAEAAAAVRFRGEVHEVRGYGRASLS